VQPKKSRRERAEAEDVAVEAEDDGLPKEPPLPWQTPPQGYDADAVRAELLAFHLYGHRRPAAVPPGGVPAAVPVALHTHLDLAAVRHDYPVVATPDECLPLGHVIDALIARSGLEGDDEERFRRHVLRLEARLRSATLDEPGAVLGDAWSAAAAALAGDEALSEDQRSVLRDNLGRARAALEHAHGTLLSCGRDAVLELFRAELARDRHARSQAWRDTVAEVVRRAEELLQVDDDHSPAAQSPEHLRDATADAGGEVDFDTMSVLLSESRIAEPLPASRRERVERALDAIRELGSLFDPAPPVAPPFDDEPVRNDCAAALERHRERMERLVSFFRALHVARLEVDNRYREPVHDAFFAGFDARYLTREEIALCPGVALVLDDAFFDNGGVTDLLELLASGAPVKILVLLDDLHMDDDLAPGVPARLGAMAAALGNVSVAQAPASAFAFLRDGLREGLSWSGTALFAAYTGESAPGDLPVYLRAASAMDARLFPALSFQPGRGRRLADRIDVGVNTQPERDWPEESFSYRAANGATVEAPTVFTTADALFCDGRLAGNFWSVPPEKWHAHMVPVAEWVGGDAVGTDAAIPYVTVVDENGDVGRAVPTRRAAEAALRCRDAWRHLRETGGVANSFVHDALDAERTALAEEKRREVEEIERTYAANLERDLGELAQEIISRIASQLLAGGALPAAPAVAVPKAAPRPATAPAEVPAPAGAPAAGATETKEEEAVSFDDPYIDTPLCTSCNDCFKINTMMFAYDANKQAYIKDADAGPYCDLVRAAEICPVKIIHPGKPKNPDEPGLDDLVARAAKFN